MMGSAQRQQPLEEPSRQGREAAAGKRGLAAPDVGVEAQHRNRTILEITAWVVAAVCLLLSLGALLGGRGHVLWNVWINTFAGLFALAMASGNLMILGVLMAIPVFPMLLMYAFWQINYMTPRPAGVRRLPRHGFPPFSRRA